MKIVTNPNFNVSAAHPGTSSERSNYSASRHQPLPPQPQFGINLRELLNKYSKPKLPPLFKQVFSYDENNKPIRGIDILKRLQEMKGKEKENRDLNKREGSSPWHDEKGRSYLSFDQLFDKSISPNNQKVQKNAAAFLEACAKKGYLDVRYEKLDRCGTSSSNPPTYETALGSDVPILVLSQNRQLDEDRPVHSLVKCFYRLNDTGTVALKQFEA